MKADLKKKKSNKGLKYSGHFLRLSINALRHVNDTGKHVYICIYIYIGHVTGQKHWFP